MTTATQQEVLSQICLCVPNICQCKDSNGVVVGPPTLGAACPVNNVDNCSSCYNCIGNQPNNTNICSPNINRATCPTPTPCNFTLRYLQSGKCRVAPRCGKGQKYDPITPTCAPCPAGTYQDKTNHREQQCIPQEMCLPSSSPCRNTWNITNPNVVNNESCYVYNTPPMIKKQVNQCRQNTRKSISRCAYKVGATQKDQCVDCDQGYHLRRVTGGVAPQNPDPYCRNNMCRCSLNICTCSPAPPGNYAASGISCPRPGNIQQCRGCPAGKHPRSNCNPGTVPVYDQSGNIVCTPNPTSPTRISDCAQNNCNCNLVIQRNQLSGVPPTGWNVVNNTLTKSYPQGAATGTLCITNGGTICDTCPTGFTKQGNVCVPQFTGTCANGKMFPILNASGKTIRNKNDQCRSCNTGYRLVFTSEVNSPAPRTRTIAECLQGLCCCVPQACPISPLPFPNATSGTCNLQNTNVSAITSNNTNQTITSLQHGKNCNPTCNTGYHPPSSTGSSVSCSFGNVTPTNLCSINQCTCSNGTASVGTPCPIHQTEQCQTCNSGFYLNSSNHCSPLTQCNSSQYESTPPTATSDRVCSNLRVCSGKEYQIQTPSPSINRVCSPRPVCPGGKYLSGQTATIAGKCVNCPGQTFNTLSGAMNQQQCLVRAICSPGRYIKYFVNGVETPSNSISQQIQLMQSQNLTPTQIRQRITSLCVPLTNCVTGHKERTPFVPVDGTSEINRICDPLQGCSPGKQIIDSSLQPIGRGFDRVCQTCPNGTYSTNGISCLNQPHCLKGQDTLPSTLLNGGLDNTKLRICRSCRPNTYSPNDEVDYINLNVCSPQPTCARGRETKTIQGQTWTSSLHNLTHRKTCVDCPPGKFSSTLNSSQCQSLTECQANEYQLQSPSRVNNLNVSDRVCQQSDGCVGGQLISMKDSAGKYVRRMNRQCGVCNTGYHLRKSSNVSNDLSMNSPAPPQQCKDNLCRCLPNVCRCGADTPPSSPARQPKISPNANGSGWNNVPLSQQCLLHRPTSPTLPNNSNCIGCEMGLYLDTTGNNNTGLCRPNVCSCPVTGSIPASNLITNDISMLSECTPTPGPHCVVNSPLRTTQVYTLNNVSNRAQCTQNGQQSCAQCPSGYRLQITNNVGSCIPYSRQCTEITTQGGKTMVNNRGFPQSQTRMDNQCSQCRPGYRLVRESDYLSNLTNLSNVQTISNPNNCRTERCVCIQNNCQCLDTNQQSIGTPSSICGPHPNTTYNQSCSSCIPGYTHNNTTMNCLANQCVCRDGNNVVGVAPPLGDPRCGKTGSQNCISCTPNYRPVPSPAPNTNNCVRFGGTCPNGTLQRVQNRTQQNECASCNPGYTLNTNTKQCDINNCLCPNGVPAGKRRVSPGSSQLVADPNTQPLCVTNNSVVCNETVLCNTGYDMLFDFDRNQIRNLPDPRFVQLSNKVCQKRCEPNQFRDKDNQLIQLHNASLGQPRTYVNQLCSSPIRSQDTCRSSNNRIKPPTCHTGYQLTGGASQYDRLRNRPSNLPNPSPTHYQPRCYDGKVYNFERSCVPRTAKATSGQQR